MDSITKKQWTLFSIGILVVAVIWIGVSTQFPGTSGNPGITAPQVGFTAPDFTLTTLTGEEITLSDLKGQGVIVNLWASWCGPCKAEMPAMQRVYEEYAEQGLEILAVNITNQDSVEGASYFVENYNLTFPIPMDVNGNVATLYNLHAFPSTYFIDRDGVIQEVVLGGPMAEALLRTRVEKILEND